VSEKPYYTIPPEILTVNQNSQLVDSGGQPQFHEILPAFIRNTSLSLVVFKLSEALGDYPDTEFYTAEQECFKLGRFSQTNEEIIQHVAKSIQ